MHNTYGMTIEHIIEACMQLGEETRVTNAAIARQLGVSKSFVQQTVLKWQWTTEAVQKEAARRRLHQQLHQLQQ